VVTGKALHDQGITKTAANQPIENDQVHLYLAHVIGNKVTGASVEVPAQQLQTLELALRNKVANGTATEEERKSLEKTFETRDNIYCSLAH
jgi:hypothetical protein